MKCARSSYHRIIFITWLRFTRLHGSLGPFLIVDVDGFVVAIVVVWRSYRTGILCELTFAITPSERSVNELNNFEKKCINAIVRSIFMRSFIGTSIYLCTHSGYLILFPLSRLLLHFIFGSRHSADVSVSYRKPIKLKCPQTQNHVTHYARSSKRADQWSFSICASGFIFCACVCFYARLLLH